MKEITRRTLEDITGGFVGWAKIASLVEECKNTQYYRNPSKMFSDEVRTQMRLKLQLRDRDLISSAFLVGGRISEVLMLRTNNFAVYEDFVIVRGAPLLKRYERKRELVETRENPPTEKAEKNHVWIWNEKQLVFEKYYVTTVPVIKERESFPIPRWEPLCEYLIERIKVADDWLFPTDYETTKKETVGVQKWIEERFNNNSRLWISPQRAFQIVSDVGFRAGLTVEKEGVKTLGIWDHWIRSQRASQLARDYEFGDNYLNAFFGWVEPRDAGTSKRYTKVGLEGLEDQMLEKVERHKRSLARDFRRG